MRKQIKAKNDLADYLEKSADSVILVGINAVLSNLVSPRGISSILNSLPIRLQGFDLRVTSLKLPGINTKHLSLWSEHSPVRAMYVSGTFTRTVLIACKSEQSKY